MIPRLLPFCCLTAAVFAAGSGLPPYKDPKLPIDRRVTDLVSRMTLAEKIAQMRGGWAGVHCFTRSGGKVDMADDWKAAIKGNGIGLLGSNLRMDPFFGIDLAKAFSRREGAEAIRAAQRFVGEQTRLGIPVFVSDDGFHGQQGVDATIYPNLCAMGATFNRALQEEVARAIATEMRSQGITIVYGPNLDVIRDPRLGRSDQNYGEDPYHVSEMGRAAVRGFQGKDLSSDRSVVCVLRAYPGVGDLDGAQDFTTCSRGPREIHEVVLRPWREAVREGAAGLMIENTSMDGIPVVAAPYYVEQVARGEWGFRGFTMDDNGAVARLVNYWRVAPGFPEAASMGLKAGVDMSMNDNVAGHGVPVRSIYGEHLPAAIEKGLVKMADIDRAVARILRVKFQLGLFEKPDGDPDRAMQVARSPEHMRLALDSARQSLVLLKNEGGRLPLAASVRSIALVGPNADDSWAQLGDYAPTHRREHVTTVLDGLRARAAKSGVAVNYARGCGIRNPSKAGFAEALEAARKSDVVVAIVGGSSTLVFPEPGARRGKRSPDSDTGESQDRATLNLMGVQEEILRELKAAGKPLVVVLIHGRAMSIPWVAANADAILDAWYPGEAGGTAIAEALFGNYNPGGRLSVSFPSHVGQLPVYYYHHPAQRKPYADMESTPTWPFGYGLSYTTFRYSNLRVTPASMPPRGTAEVTVEVANTGKLAGDEVAQLYVRDDVASTVRPYKMLRGFERVHLRAGETKEVKFRIGWDELSFVGPDMKWVVEPGTFTLMVGPNSKELPLMGKLTVTQ